MFFIMYETFIPIDFKNLILAL